jgi:hypothetical protein
MREITVEMGEFACTSDSKTILVTIGVTTCIAFIINGSYFDDDKEEHVSFCALYHWSGFNSPPKDPDKLVRLILNKFLCDTRNALKLSSEHLITIHKLNFIGGEEAQYDVNGALLISGTETEVHSLVRTVNNFCFAKNHYEISENAIQHNHFKTTNQESIDIKVQIRSCEFYLDRPNCMLPVQEQVSPALK